MDEWIKINHTPPIIGDQYFLKQLIKAERQDKDKNQTKYAWKCIDFYKKSE
jgi:hypothetical protein